MRDAIAIIPARGGSKRIPRKNIRDFQGKPAIAYAIEGAIQANIFKHVVVSTDDSEIAQISMDYGANYIVNRQKKLADDLTPTVPVIANAIEMYQEAFLAADIDVCCIYPINPFLNSKDLIQGLLTLRESKEISYVNSICSYSYPIQRAIKVKDGIISMINPELALTRSQDLEETYHDAGQWYWGKSETWLRQEKLLFNSKGVVIPRWRCQDIDTEEDWQEAELLYRAIISGS